MSGQFNWPAFSLFITIFVLSAVIFGGKHYHLMAQVINGAKTDSGAKTKEKIDTNMQTKTGTDKKSQKAEKYSRQSEKQVKNNKLTELQEYVTQRNGTEPAFKNEYWDNKEPGI